MEAYTTALGLLTCLLTHSSVCIMLMWLHFIFEFFSQAVIESEECIERIACQVGALAQDAGLDNTISNMAVFMAPAKYTKYVKQFAKPSHCEKIKCGNMF